MTPSAEVERRQMIDQQVRTWEVLDSRVLEAMSSVPREQFVPPAFRGVAFADVAIPLGHGQYMLPPRLDGRILQALAPARHEAVLEVGTGSGYLAACLARLAGSVHTLEILPELAETARSTIGRLGIAGITVETADAMRWSGPAQFDAVALTGSLPVYDPRFERLLAPGGRLFVVVGTGPAMDARRVTRSGGQACVSESLFETRIDPLANATPAPRFRF